MRANAAEPRLDWQADPKLSRLAREGLLMRGTDKRLLVRSVSTGIAALDEVMNGGVPLNRYTEIYGPWSAGKTLLSQLIAANFQKLGLSVALIDAEFSYDEDWWKEVGVDVGPLIVSQPIGGEQAVDVAAALIGSVGLIIIDSIAGMVPMSTQERGAEESSMGRQAQLVSRLYQKTLGPLIRTGHAGSGTAMIALNQVRTSFTPGQFDALPGGRSQEFFANTMLSLRRSEWIKEGDRRVGFRMLVHTQKSKRGEPHKETILPFRFNGTWDKLTMVIEDAVAKNVILRAGSWFRFKADLLGDMPLPEFVKVVEGTDMVQVMGREALNALLKDVNLDALEAATYASDDEERVSGFSE